MCLRVLSVGVSYHDVECLSEVYTSVVDVFKPVEGQGATTVVFVVHCVEGVLPAGETFARVPGDVKGTVRLTSVVLNGQAGAVTAGYEPGGGDASAVVADGGELDGCTYGNTGGDEQVTVTINEDVASLVGEGDAFGGFVGLLVHDVLCLSSWGY